MWPPSGRPVPQPEDDHRDGDQHRGGDQRRPGACCWRPSPPRRPPAARARDAGATGAGIARRSASASDRPSPASASSSGVPSTVTRSPIVTMWSRPGQATVARPVGRDHGHRGQGPEQGPQGGVPLHLDLGGHEPGAGQLDLVRVAAQAGLDDGRGGQGGHVEHGARPGDLGHRRAHGGVGQLDHHPDLGAQLADQEGGLQGLDLGALGADHRPGRRQPGLLQDARRAAGCPRCRGCPSASTTRTRRGSGSSSTTTTPTPAWWSCSTIRRPTPWRPHTMTWPCPVPARGIGPSRYGAPPAFPPDCRSVSGSVPGGRPGPPGPGRRGVVRAQKGNTRSTSTVVPLNSTPL